MGSSHGELEGSTKIVEEKLASELGFSRTPIHDSIRRLEYEGLIVRKKSSVPDRKRLTQLV
ncbi:UNVERIFIED_ORG: DNA-binding GntR family transcriptional regulator [Bacillus sp. 1751]|nr:DNA-binding GntR family transcriptional regulator [Bacillus sp. 1751]